VRSADYFNDDIGGFVFGGRNHSLECGYDLTSGITIGGRSQWMIVANLSDVTSHVTRFYGLPPFFGLTINLDIWNDMPKDYQEILIEEAWRMSDAMTQRQLSNEPEEKDILTSMGMEVYDLPKAERERWKTAVAPYVDQKLADMGEFGDRIREIAKKANAENP